MPEHYGEHRGDMPSNDEMVTLSFRYKLGPNTALGQEEQEGANDVSGKEPRGPRAMSLGRQNGTVNLPYWAGSFWWVRLPVDLPFTPGRPGVPGSPTSPLGPGSPISPGGPCGPGIPWLPEGDRFCRHSYQMTYEWHSLGRSSVFLIYV